MKIHNYHFLMWKSGYQGLIHGHIWLSSNFRISQRDHWFPICIMWGRDSLPKQPDPGHEYLEKGRPEEMMCSLQIYVSVIQAQIASLTKQIR